MRVFRVEHTESKLGPWYHRGDYAYPPSCLTFRHELMPTPYMEGLSVPYNWRCAFPSLQDLYHWFGPERHELALLGFFFVEYEVAPEHSRSGAVQVIFDFDQAEFIGRVP